MKKFLYKNGAFSKTSCLLTIGFCIVAFKYALGGMNILGIEIPVFDPEGAFAFLGTISALYVGNHNVKIGQNEIVHSDRGSKNDIYQNQQENKPGC